MCIDFVAVSCIIITQYGSTLYIGIAMGGPALQKEMFVFTFSFNLNMSSKDTKVENM